MAYVCVIINKKRLHIQSISYTPNKCTVHQHKVNSQYLECFRFTTHMASPTKTWLTGHQLPNTDACHATGTSILSELVRDKACGIFNTVKWQMIDPVPCSLPGREESPKGGRHSYACKEHFHSDLKHVRSKEHSKFIIWRNRN